MAGIREVLATNLKEYRRMRGYSQDKLAELANISSQYLATIETCRKFPTPEVMDLLAAALGIKTHQLFEVSATPEEALERLYQTVAGNIGRVVADAVEKTLSSKCP
ncbi:hypothetical protein AGMMS49579_14990 [Spirochaetia bacterium]|nr:hypothetical protein AGMMS49579_14990 [Spirochaetia bacterium]